MEKLDICRTNVSDAAKLGRGLANMHKNKSHRLYKRFGFEMDGYCGAGQQLNENQKESKLG